MQFDSLGVDVLGPGSGRGGARRACTLCLFLRPGRGAPDFRQRLSPILHLLPPRYCSYVWLLRGSQLRSPAHVVEHSLYKGRNDCLLAIQSSQTTCLPRFRESCQEVFDVSLCVIKHVVFRFKYYEEKFLIITIHQSMITNIR